ncbi:hypothetical protein OROMI_014820 [Orobanche minor]
MVARQILLQKDLGIFGSLDNMDHPLENEGLASWGVNASRAWDILCGICCFCKFDVVLYVFVR